MRGVRRTRIGAPNQKESLFVFGRLRPRSPAVLGFCVRFAHGLPPACAVGAGGFLPFVRCGRQGFASPLRALAPWLSSAFCRLAPSGASLWGVGCWLLAPSLLGGVLAAPSAAPASVGRGSLWSLVCLVGGSRACSCCFVGCLVRPLCVRAVGWFRPWRFFPPVVPRRVWLRGCCAVLLPGGGGSFCGVLGSALAARLSRLRGAPGSRRFCGFCAGGAGLPGGARSRFPRSGGCGCPLRRAGGVLFPLCRLGCAPWLFLPLLLLALSPLVALLFALPVLRPWLLCFLALAGFAALPVRGALSALLCRAAFPLRLALRLLAVLCCCALRVSCPLLAGVAPVASSAALAPAPLGAVVGFSGGRRLPSVFRPLVAGVAAGVAGAGRSVVVGCAGGADCFVRSAVPAAAVFRAASFGSGRAAFAARSVALVRAVAAGGPGSGLVVFPAAPCPPGLFPSPRSGACFCGLGSGSWASAAFAAGLGVRVVVFPCGFSALPPWGSWRPLAGAWSGGFLLVP